MRYYEIQLPARDNAGKLTKRALANFERVALKTAGGFNRSPAVEGAWQGSKVFRDMMVPYRLACTEAQFGLLLLSAFDLFPDQEAIFTADLGQANIAERPAVQSIAA